ncbi:Nucleotide-binding alpha-beta plait domain [Phytophthora cactorum]|nr:Nucleotide-binding alpha-beta plait domain [Phytophthora cactorum]
MSDRGSPSPRRSRSRSPSFRADENEDKKSPRVSDNEERETSRRSRSRSPAPKAPAAPADVVNPGNNLYVANLATRVGQQDLQELFSKFGRVDKCEVIVDPVTKESRWGLTVTFDTERRMLMLLLNGRGFGFVTFEDVRDAEDAVKELNKCVGLYLGPRLASAKYGSGRERFSRDRSRDRGRRSRSRDRGGYSRRHDDRDRGRNDDRGRGRYDDRDRGRGGYDRDSYDDRRRR